MRVSCREEKMQELPVTWQRTASVWWLIVWRAGLGAAILGGIIGAIIGFVGAAMGGSIQSIVIFSQLVGAVVGLVWSFVAVGMALRKKYRGFRLALVPPSST
jgi:hypothetical protein